MMTTPRTFVIGIAGQKMSGKTTLANEIKKNFGADQAEITNFANKIKMTLLNIFTDVNPDYWFKSEYKGKVIPGLDVTPREVMQKFGTDFMRSVDQHYWEKACVADIRRILNKGKRVVIVDDVRFPSEARALRAHFGAEIIRVHRVETDIDYRKKWYQLWKPVGHPSENQLDTIQSDIQISNNYSVERMYAHFNNITRCPPHIKHNTI